MKSSFLLIRTRSRSWNFIVVHTYIYLDPADKKILNKLINYITYLTYPRNFYI